MNAAERFFGAFLVACGVLSALTIYGQARVHLSDGVQWVLLLIPLVVAPLYLWRRYRG